MAGVLHLCGFMKWKKRKGSLESWLHCTVFCWDKHVKECFPETDTGKDKGRLVKKVDIGEKGCSASI